MDGWMDDMRLYVLSNSISVISGRWEVDNKSLCAMGKIWKRNVSDLSLTRYGGHDGLQRIIFRLER